MAVRNAFIRYQEQLCVSTVTVMELIYGVETSSSPTQNLAVVESFLARLAVLDYDRRAAQHTGQLRAELQKRGTPWGPTTR